MLKRGDLMYYVRDDTAPVKLLSEPYDWGGQMVVTAKKMAKKKCNWKWRGVEEEKNEQD